MGMHMHPPTYGPAQVIYFNSKLQIQALIEEESLGLRLFNSIRVCMCRLSSPQADLAPLIMKKYFLAASVVYCQEP